MFYDSLQDFALSSFNLTHLTLDRSYFGKNNSWKKEVLQILVCGIKKLIRDSRITNP